MCACEAARLLLHSRKEPQHKLNLCLGQRVIRRLPRPLAPSLVVRSGRGRRLVSCPAGCGINAAFCLVRDLPKELSSPRASERAAKTLRPPAGNGRSAKEKEWERERGEREFRRGPPPSFLLPPYLFAFVPWADICFECCSRPDSGRDSACLRTLG